MASLPSEVHERTKIGNAFRWGCHDKVRTRLPYPVPCGHILVSAGGGLYESTPIYKLIPSVSSLECRNDKSETDVHCRGCMHIGGGEAYDLFVRSQQQ